MDDNVGQACLAQSTLARAGYVVELAPGRAEALTRHAMTPYDVLLIDHDMPGMNGIEVLETLGTWGPFPPTIMVTGHGDEAIAVEAMKGGPVITSSKTARDATLSCCQQSLPASSSSTASPRRSARPRWLCRRPSPR